MAETPTTLSAWIGGIADSLGLLGLNSRGLLRAVHLSGDLLAQPHSRLPSAQLTALWDLAIQQSGRTDLGLCVAEHLSMTAVPALGTALLSSTSAADACQRIERYLPLVSDAVSFRVEAGIRWIDLNLDSAWQGSQVSDADIDLILASLCRFLRDASLGSLQPASLHLRRGPPAEPANYQSRFCDEIQFGASANRLRYPREHWSAPMPGADVEIDDLGEQLLENYLQHWETDPITTQARAQIVQLLPSGEPDLAQVASALRSSTRTLQRRLDQANTSFSGLIRTARQELANSYLSDTRYSLKDVAFLLGFSDQANFSRAFKNWYGIAPGRYRRQLKERQARW